MNYNYILSFFEDKRFLIVAFILICSFFIGYKVGYQSAYTPREVLCKDDIYQLAQLSIQHKEALLKHTQELVSCKTDCQIESCKPMCTDLITEAVESYKALDVEFQCGAQQ